MAAPLSTFDFTLADGGQIPVEERAPAEVTRLYGQEVPPSGAPALNQAFAVTPNEREVVGFRRAHVETVSVEHGGSHRTPDPVIYRVVYIDPYRFIGSQFFCLAAGATHRTDRHGPVPRYDFRFFAWRPAGFRTGTSGRSDQPAQGTLVA